LRSDRTIQNFLWRESVNVDVWKFVLDRLAECYVKITFHLRGQTCLDTDFGGSIIPGFFGSPYYFLNGEKIALLLSKITAKSAEATSFYAYVGKIYVSIYYKRYDISDCHLS
jgi:hypothetical protein